MVIPFIEAEVEEEVEEIEEEENGYKKGQWKAPMEISLGEMVEIMVWDLNLPLLPVDHNQVDRMMNGWCPLLL